MSTSTLDKFTGIYNREKEHAPLTVIRKNNKLMADFYHRKGFLELVPVSKNQFVMKDTDGQLTFEIDDAGKIAGVYISHR